MTTTLVNGEIAFKYVEEEAQFENGKKTAHILTITNGETTMSFPGIIRIEEFLECAKAFSKYYEETRLHL